MLDYLKNLTLRGEAMPLNIRTPEKYVTLIELDEQSKMNAMSRQMLGEIADLWEKLDADPGCRAIVLTGAGDRAFCAGADIGGDLTASEEMAEMVNRALLKTHAISKPVIAAVNGVCAGGGVELLLSTDIRIAADHARIGLPEVRYSIYPFGGAVVKLFKQIGYTHAMDLLLTGRLITASDAANLGLYTRVLSKDKVLDNAIETATLIAANSPPAVQAVKKQVAQMIAFDAIQWEKEEQELGDVVRASNSFKEGVAAFLEKRTPNYD